ncbi:transcriptional regulator ArgP [Endozoicomonas sp. OPT23]|uniref:LysR family transcriptional regulator ArgP n=1 Tax=Endozoicomonas sp. OPT23 TaxID=2072845 RepID=UPI00129ACF96|nr:LysR family transcriptional regulator ArgP [Endozoicomonas sp. OPT23]MRI32935.1 transcriptional regulator ArgP [Endozoicomonas sp. OPT23]
MFDYKLLAALTEVVHQGSFERAAQSLALTQSAVSQRIKLLEQRVGLPLLVRSTPVQATEEGMKLIQHSRQVQLLERDLMTGLQQTSEQTFQTVHLAVNADSLATWLPAIFSPLFEKNILLNFTLDDQDVTHEYLKAGSVMGCITTKQQPHQGCRSEKLGEMEYITVATPEFVDRYKNHSFSDIPTIEFGCNDNLHNEFLMEHFSLQPGQYPAHKLPSTEAFLDAARAGIAYAIAPRLQAQPFLDTQEVIEMTPEKTITVPLYWHYWSLTSEIMEEVSHCILKSAKQILK